MKHLFLSLLGFMLFTSLSAQSYKFNGDWSGKISVLGSNDDLWVRISIKDNYITQYFYDNDTNGWEPVAPIMARYGSNKNNFLYFWMNNSEVWSETQTYMLSYVNDEKLYVVWSRQVNNIKQDEDNNVWSLQGSGYLTRRN
ncbi:hypothetical protein OCK74_12000 [Chitinophagaceae bacterium LB-8]|uniref:Uncharacterized protein n=1 Tax=Paraflavisolibacter caeni TaxID=2982496 RepID=A0A9X2XV27_9BACT|nr:hypothetical protein [Paraflavisolibacter caeni]MCU7549844.1 hypothetical protein [Paraflavisolibacter caeni]